MSRGRQKRVEKNHQRRVESKKQKARKEIKSLYKSLVQTQLFPFLDKLGDLIVRSAGSSESFHIWVDSQPLSQKECKDVAFPSANGIIEEESKQKKGKIPNTSTSTSTNHHQKKAHPRNSTTTNDIDDVPSTDDEVLLCRSQFFTGQCMGFKSNNNSSRRKSAGPGSCKHHHYSSDRVTLYQSLGKQNVDILQKASFASALSQIKLDDTAGPDPDQVNGIDMLYHIRMDLTAVDANMSLSQSVSRLLVSENVPISSIAYVVFSNTLVFDRFDGGKAFDEEAEERFLDSYSWIAINTDQSNKAQNTEDGCSHILSLSGHLFEYILTFLPTKYSGLLPTCCKTFYNEIGTHSPGLWTFLLKRHDWSFCPSHQHGNPDDDDMVSIQKQLFVGHYSTCQQVESLSKGVLQILSSEQKDGKNQHHMNALFKFGSNQNTGDESIILFWDESTVLVASRVGCYFRMVSVVESSGQNICKEVLMLRITPTPNTKNTKWYLESIAVDDRYLVCMYSVMVASTKEYVVTTMMKDQLLTNAMDGNITADGGVLRDHELKFLLFKDALEHQKKKYSSLIFALMDDITGNNLRIEVHDDIQPCGNGVFCTVLSVFNTTTTDIVLNGWLTFSASVGRDFIIEYNDLPFSDTQCSTNYLRKNRIDATDVLIGSEFTDDLHLPSINRNGKLQKNCHLYQSLNLARDSLLSDYMLLNGRKIVTSRLDLTEGIINETYAHSSVVIYIQDKKPCMGSDSAPCSLVLKNLYNRLISMNFLHNQEYLLLLCTRQKSLSNSENKMLCLDFIVVHVASETEIYCSSIDGTRLVERGELVPLNIETNEYGTMAIVIKDDCMCITNAKINGTEDDMDDISQRVKKMKLKKRLVALTGKGGKKQGTGIAKL